MEGCCGDSLRLQRAMLTRLVLRDAEGSQRYGMGEWGNGLLCADSVFMWKRKIAVGDMQSCSLTM